MGYGNAAVNEDKCNITKDILNYSFHPLDLANENCTAIETNELKASRNQADNPKMANAGAADENVCRDFLRNQCKREDGCKFTHPNTTIQSIDRALDDNVCRDFVRNVCKRGISCKFTFIF